MVTCRSHDCYMLVNVAMLSRESDGGGGRGEREGEGGEGRGREGWEGKGGEERGGESRTIHKIVNLFLNH